jgi:hypothetical protein
MVRISLYEGSGPLLEATAMIEEFVKSDAPVTTGLLLVRFLLLDSDWPKMKDVSRVLQEFFTKLLTRLHPTLFSRSN